MTFPGGDKSGFMNLEYKFNGNWDRKGNVNLRVGGYTDDVFLNSFRKKKVALPKPLSAMIISSVVGSAFFNEGPFQFVLT